MGDFLVEPPLFFGAHTNLLTLKVNFEPNFVFSPFNHLWRVYRYNQKCEKALTDLSTRDRDSSRRFV
jgi:hypothetical protein